MLIHFISYITFFILLFFVQMIINKDFKFNQLIFQIIFALISLKNPVSFLK